MPLRSMSACGRHCNLLRGHFLSWPGVQCGCAWCWAGVRPASVRYRTARRAPPPAPKYLFAKAGFTTVESLKAQAIKLSISCIGQLFPCFVQIVPIRERLVYRNRDTKSCAIIFWRLGRRRQTTTWAGLQRLIDHLRPNHTGHKTAVRYSRCNRLIRYMIRMVAKSSGIGSSTWNMVQAGKVRLAKIQGWYEGTANSWTGNSGISGQRRIFQKVEVALFRKFTIISRVARRNYQVATFRSRQLTVNGKDIRWFVRKHTPVVQLYVNKRAVNIDVLTL